MVSHMTISEFPSTEDETAPHLLSPPSHVRQSGDGHEVGVTRLLGQGPPQSSVTFSAPGIERNGGGFSVAEILQAAERDGEKLESNDIFTASVTDTLIRDQEEPSVMREAAEFSRFEPDHLTTVIDRNSPLHGAHIPSSVGQQALNSLLGGGDNGGQPGEGEEGNGNEEYSTSPEVCEICQLFKPGHAGTVCIHYHSYMSMYLPHWKLS